MSTNSPFRFGKVVTGDAFVNREPEKLRIRNNILSFNNTIIISPRRWGKSSLMKQVAAEMESRKIRFVFLDIFNIRTEEEFFTAYSREILKASMNRKEEILNVARKFFTRIVPVISFRADPLNDISLKFNWEETREAIDEVIDLPEKVALDKGLRLVVCIDEFQSIARIRESDKLEEVLRSYWQHHENVSYCLYGSKKHMMSDIFNNETRPFYRFGDIIHLSKVPEQHWTGFITGGFARSGKSVSDDLVGELVQIADNHPEYIQQLAHYTWSLTEKNADHDTLSSAVELVLDSNSLFFLEVCDNLSLTQLNLIKAVMKGESQFTSVEVMRVYNLGTPRNVSKNKDLLESKDIIDFSSDPAQFNDPFFKIWFRRNFSLE